MNLLFGTSFEIMDREKGRNQTTKGVWLSKAKVSNKRVRISFILCDLIPVQEADIFVMDVEGTDSRERGDQMAVRLPLLKKNNVILFISKNERPLIFAN